jgi:hypothetical protein
MIEVERSPAGLRHRFSSRHLTGFPDLLPADDVTSVEHGLEVTLLSRRDASPEGLCQTLSCMAPSTRQVRTFKQPYGQTQGC